MSMSSSSAPASSLSRALSSRAAARGRGRVVGRAAAAARRRARPSASPSAYTQYTLDGPGCAAARSEADWHSSVLLENHPEGCPPRPVDVTERCEAGDGAFALGNARFEQRGEDLYLSVVDAAPATAAEEEGTTTRAESEGAGGEYVAGESKELEREREFDDEREGGVGGGGFYAGA
jgi:hypothetical protein